MVAAMAVGCGDDGGGAAGTGGSAGSGGSGGSAGMGGGGGTGGVQLPVTPIEFVTGEFMSSEGIAFNGEGRLFVVGDTDLWEISATGETNLVADLINPVGLASLGGRDILVGEFGPLGFTADGPNDDGEVLQVTPDGTVSTLATGIGDPNFIHVRSDGSLLVSDDFTDIIYEVPSGGGMAAVFLQGIQSPNGIVESIDGSELYVAQTFTTVDPLSFDDRVWKVPLTDGDPGTPELLAELGGAGANDGVTLDANGMLYVAENLDSIIWRVDPATGDKVIVAENVSTVASLAFGEGDFNSTSIYATSLFSGTIFEIPVGVEGAPVNR